MCNIFNSLGVMRWSPNIRAMSHNFHLGSISDCDLITHEYISKSSVMTSASHVVAIFMSISLTTSAIYGQPNLLWERACASVNIILGYLNRFFLLSAVMNTMAIGLLVFLSRRIL